MRVAVLEDDPEMARWVGHLLEDAGHSVETHATGRALLRRCATESFDLFVLDWELPDVSGLDVLRAMRAQLVTSTPVLFLTHHESEDDIVAALEAGADDYLVKPPREREFLSRVRVLMRRRDAGAGRGVVELGRYRLDVARREVLREGNAIELSPREFAVAAMLFQNAGKVISRAHMMLTLWGNAAGTSSRTVDTHVSRVRNALELAPANGVRLTTVYGYGYRLDATPER